VDVVLSGPRNVGEQRPVSSIPDRFPPLHPGESVDNRRLTEIFRCSPQGGLRRSLQTNSLVLIWDTTQSIYLNRWREGIIHYAGIGLVGDQELHRAPPSAKRRWAFRIFFPAATAADSIASS